MHTNSNGEFEKRLASRSSNKPSRRKKTQQVIESETAKDADNDEIGVKISQCDKDVLYQKVSERTWTISQISSMSSFGFPP